MPRVLLFFWMDWDIRCIEGIKAIKDVFSSAFVNYGGDTIRQALYQSFLKTSRKN